MPECTVCGALLSCQWTDTHGVGVCVACGTPYRIYHYEGDRRVEKPPELMLTELGVEIARRYWTEKQMRVFPGMYDMGFPSGQSYSGATVEEAKAWRTWYDTNYPPPPETTAEPEEETTHA